MTTKNGKIRIAKGARSKSNPFTPIEQAIETIHPLSHDIAMTAIVTETGTLTRDATR